MKQNASSLPDIRRVSLFTPSFKAAYLSLFLITTGNGLFVLYPLHLKSFGKNDAHIGALMGVAALAALFSRPFLGPAIDRCGRRAFIAWGSLINGLVILLYALPYHDNLFLTPLRIVHGLVFAAYFTAVWTWVADQAPPGRMAESLGIFGTAGLSSGAAGAYLGETSMRIFNGSLPAFYAVASALVLAGSMLSSRLPEAKGIGSPPRHGFLGLIRRFDIFTVALACAVFGAAMGGVHTFASPFIEQCRQISVSSFFLVYSGSAIAVRLLAGKAADRMGRITLIIPGLLFLAAGLVILGSFRNAWSTLLMGFILGGGHGLIYPALYALMLERAGPTDKGSAGALLNASADTGSFGGSTIFGIIATQWGYSLMFIDAGFAVLGGLLLFLILERLARNRGRVERAAGI